MRLEHISSGNLTIKSKYGIKEGNCTILYIVSRNKFNLQPHIKNEEGLAVLN